MKIRRIIIYLIILFSIFGITDVFALELTEEQRALVETMDAFNRKGSAIQYDGLRFSFDTYPELATSQNTVYTHCSNFAYSVYKNALGIETPKNASLIMAHSYHDGSEDDIIRFWDKDDLDQLKLAFSEDEDWIDFLRNVIAADLQVGDLITTFKTNSGHTMLVYDIERDSDDNILGVTLMEATSKYESSSTKLGTNGLSYNSTGAIRKTNLKTRIDNFLFNNNSDDYTYLSVVRPLAFKIASGEDKYIYADCDRTLGTNIYDMDNFTCDTSVRDFAISDTAKSRIKYSNIDIEKTVTNSNGIINGSDVELNDELIYSIKITNHNNVVYNDLVITENVPNYVDIIENNGELSNGTITWNINVPVNATRTVSYKVKVKNNTANYGKEIVSTGKVDNIKTPPMKNKIIEKFSDTDKAKIVEAYNLLKNSSTKKGLEFINTVYLRALDIDMNFDSLNLEELINNVITSSEPSSISINKNNSFASLVYTNYYGALRVNNNVYNMKYWENNWLSTSWTGTQVEGRSERRDTIYKEHFETGDVLVFKNSNDPKTLDDGVYAYIYIEDSFYGLNTDDKNEFSTTATLSNENSYLNTLLGKDYYVVLRPSYDINIVKAKDPVITPYVGIYNESPCSITVDDVTDGEVYYSLDNSTWSKTNPTRTEIGETVVYVKVVGDEYHSDSNVLTGTITIEDEFDYSIDNYDVDDTDKYISGIMVNTTVDDFKNRFNLGAGYEVVVDYKIVNNKKVLYTGGKTKIMKGSTVYREYTNIVIGDINGDGVINSADLLRIRQHLLRTKELSGVYYIAANVNYDNTINSADLLRIRQHLLGIKYIN